MPLSKALDDAIVALYQNGEHLRPGNGYPMRLFLPGWEGNMSVKWLRRIEVTAGPTMTKDETSKYSDLMPDGTSLLFTFPMEVKSVITSPSGTSTMQGPGLYQISGVAWSGEGLIRRVEVSADDGQSWAEAALDDPVLPMSLTRLDIRVIPRGGSSPSPTLPTPSSNGNKAWKSSCFRRKEIRLRSGLSLNAVLQSTVRKPSSISSGESPEA